MSTYRILNEQNLPYNAVGASVRSDAGDQGSTIDVSCAMLDISGAVLDTVSLANRASQDGSTRHIDLDLRPDPDSSPWDYKDTYAVSTRLDQVRADAVALYYAAHSPAGLDFTTRPPLRAASVVAYQDDKITLVPEHRMLPDFGQGHGVVLGCFIRVAGGGWLAYEVASVVTHAGLPMGAEQLHGSMQQHLLSITQSL